MNGTMRMIADSGREAVIAFMAIATQPGLLLRLGGLPMVLYVLGQALIVTLNPQPTTDMEDPAFRAWLIASAPQLMLYGLFAVWVQVRLTVQVTRWAVAGDVGPGFLAPGFGRRELRYLGWMIVASLGLLPAFILMVILTSLLNVVGMALGLFVVAYVQARLMPGLIPVAFDAPQALAKSWEAVVGRAVPGAVAVFLLFIPLQMLQFLTTEAMPFAGVLSVVISAVSLLFQAALTVLLVRLWRLAGEPGAPRVTPTE